MVFDTLMKRIKKFCNNDDTCILVILVLTGFLLCMFFNRDEGFSLEGAPITDDKQPDTFTPGFGRTGSADAEPAVPEPVKTEPTLGLKPLQHVPSNGYGSAQRNIEELRKQPQLRMDGKTQMGQLTQEPSVLPMGVFDGKSGGYYPFQELMRGNTVLSEWKQDKPIGKAPTPIDTPGPPTPADEPGPAPGPAPGPGAKKVMTLVLFYAPWCGHSRNMLEDYNAVIDEYNGKTKDGVSYEVIKVDMDKDKDAAKRYEVEIRGFPTLYTFYTVGDKSIKKIFNHRTKDEIILELEKRGQEIN